MEEEIVSGYEPVIEDMDCDADPEHCEEYLMATDYIDESEENIISKTDQDLANNLGTTPFIAASLAIIVVIIVVAVLSRKKKS